VQVGPMRPTLKAPGTKCLKLQYDVPLSNFAFEYDLRRYSECVGDGISAKPYPPLSRVGRWRLTLSNPR